MRSSCCKAEKAASDAPNVMRAMMMIHQAKNRVKVLTGRRIVDREKRVVVWIDKSFSMTKTGAWGCVQSRERWSPEEEVHMRSGHH